MGAISVRERRRISRGTAATIFVAVVLLLFDAYLGGSGPLHVLRLATDVVVLGLTWVVALECRRGRTLRAFGVGCLTAAGSAALSAFPASATPQWSDGPGLLEWFSLLVLWVLACRNLPYWQLLLIGVLDMVALAGLLTRDSWPVKLVGTSSVLLLPLLLLLTGGFALYLRFEAGRRELASEQARQSERLELARDLHDHVTHYVTAIVVQAQAGQEAIGRDAETGHRLFTNIERTGQEGLVAMNRMVRLLRDRESAAEFASQPGIAALQEKLGEVALPGCSVHFELPDESETASWSPGVARSVERVVQEGLTNVRKHAREATRVQVGVSADADLITIRVRDDGGRGGRGRFRPSGFGMIGLSERITELGGELTSGACPDGGWELAARIPKRQGWD